MRCLILFASVLLCLTPRVGHAAAPPTTPPAAAQTNAPAAATPTIPALSPEEEETRELTRQQALINARVNYKKAQLESELTDLMLEKQRLDAELSLNDARRKKAMDEEIARANELTIKVKTAESELKVALAELRKQKETLAMEMALRSEQAKQAEAEAREEIDRIKLAMEKKSALQDQELQALQARQKELAAKNQLAAEERKAALAELAAENERLSMELTHAQKLHEQKVQELTAATALLALENSKAQQEQARRENEHKAAMTTLQHELDEVQSAMTLRDTREAYHNRVDRDIKYPLNPFQDGVLTISDRRIPLNGIIIEGVADYVTERIHFFNNQSSSQPIFIVIDRSPGGSVMEGYRILKAMEASQAPVHVVVKSFAASMAATIATAAEYSYAYPNAILLHHQPSSFSWGNITQQDEQMKMFKEWARRLHATIADKMGVTMDEFYTMMYEHNSDGDWQEFADQAQKLHWVSHVVNEIREEGIVARPTDEMPSWNFLFMKHEPPTDPKDDYVLLPRLKPFDYYFIYNPNSYYRWVQ